MNHPPVEPGAYVISHPFAKTVLDVQEGRAVGYPYTMSQSQTWTFQRSFANFWTIQNTLSQRYLGLRTGDTACNKRILYEIEDPFPWRIDFNGSYISLAVAYSNFHIDLEGGWSSPGNTIFLYENGGWENRMWILSRPVAPPLEDGAVYSIVSDASGIAIEINHSHEVRATHTNAQRTSQLFRAVKTGTGWAFKHRDSDLYLGFPTTMVTLAREAKLRAVAHEVSWMVLPAVTFGNDSPAFKIFFPYSDKLMDLEGGKAQDGARIQVNENGDQAFKLWKFQKLANDTGDFMEPGALLQG